MNVEHRTTLYVAHIQKIEKEYKLSVQEHLTACFVHTKTVLDLKRTEHIAPVSKFASGSRCIHTYRHKVAGSVWPLMKL